jgi:hypothetical protein
MKNLTTEGTGAQRLAANRVRIVDLLIGTGREGMDQLVEWLVKEGFFEAPASTKYHGVYEGGLAQHSLNVLERLSVMAAAYGMDVPRESLVIACLLHDVCKVGAYVALPNDDCRLPIEYRWNKEQPKGHAALSIKRIQKFIKLTEIEELMIKFHMGVYGLNEFEPGKGEYPLRGGGMANAWHHHPIVKLMYFADELATLGEKGTDVSGKADGSEPK